MALAEELKAEAVRLGFHRVGIARAEPSPDHPRLVDWLARGDHAGMEYMERGAEPRRSPDSILEGAKSVVMAALLYGPGPITEPGPTTGRVARYAQGPDYHELLWRRLEELLDWLRRRVPDVRARAVADTAPLLERDFARRAGLGWIGKNTMLIDPKIGSFTVLGALLVDLELDADEPFEAFRCGTCARCLDACPTDAFRAPFQLDATKCLSYWTIEHKGPMPDAAAEALGDRVFGCDVCQDVCPWNRKVRETPAPEWATPGAWTEPDLLEWLRRDPAEFARAIKGTPLARTKRRGLVRNAIHILAERKVREAEPEFERLLRDDPDPVVRDAAERGLRRSRRDDPSGFEPVGS